MLISFLRYDMQGAPSRHKAKLVPAREGLAPSNRYSTVELIVIGANGVGATLAPRSLCDGHHKKALFIAELRKKNRAFLTAPALAGISSDLMQSREATDDCRRRPIGLCADAQIRDDGPNMEKIGRASCRERVYTSGE